MEYADLPILLPLLSTPSRAACLCTAACNHVRVLSLLCPLPQVVLRAREAISRYYDGLLRPDDETADAPGGCRAAVLRPPGGGPGQGAEEGGGAGPDRCAHPDPQRHGVLLRRAVGERDLYLQVGVVCLCGMVNWCSLASVENVRGCVYNTRRG